MRLWRICAAFVAVTAAVAPGARAADPGCRPSPDVAALDQYCDFLPSPTGDEQPLDFAAQPVQTPVSRALATHEVEMLRNIGPEGTALLMLPAVAPVRPSPEQRRRMLTTRRRVLDSAELEEPEVTAKSVVTGVTAGVSAVGERALNGVFQWALLVCTMGFAGMAWLRFRTRLKP